MKYLQILFIFLISNYSFSQNSNKILLDSITIFSNNINYKKQLFEILNNTYKLFDNNQIYKYDTSTLIENNTGNTLEEENGFFQNNSYYNILFNINYKNDDYKKIDPVAFYSFIKKNYFYFDNNSSFKNFKKNIENLELIKVNDTFILYKDNWKENIILEIDKENKILKKITNNVSNYDFYDIKNNFFFKRNSIIIERNITLTFIYLNNKIIQNTEGFELYKINNSNLKTYKKISIIPYFENLNIIKKYNDLGRITFTTIKRIK